MNNKQKKPVNTKKFKSFECNKNKKINTKVKV